MAQPAVTARESERPRAAPFAALLACVGAATVAAVAAGGTPLLALLPVTLATALYAVARAPLRVSAAALLFAVLSLDTSADAGGTWRTPLAALGDLLQDNLERSAGIPGVGLNGVDVGALLLLGVAALRKRSALDREGAVPAPRVIGAFLLLHLAGLLYAELVGLAAGAPVAIWKLHQLLQVPLLAVLFLAAFRGPRDHRLLARIVVLAACVKALLAVWVQRVAAPALTGGKLAYATSHGDSVLFAVAAFILFADLAAVRDRRGAVKKLVLLGVVLLGMHENARRTAWVMLTMSAVAAYAIAPMSSWKRAMHRRVLLAAPLVVLYAAVGWDRGGRLFAPIQTFRTLSDSTMDSSTRWREIENWNLAMSIRERPILGIGLGQEYTEFVRGDDISSAFADYRAWPHNSTLGLLLFAGPIAYTAVMALFGLVVFLAVRSYRRALQPEDRVAALACVATVISCGVLAFGDTGVHYAQYRVLLALSIGVSAKLAVATGAWPTPLRRTKDVRTTVGAAARSS